MTIYDRLKKGINSRINKGLLDDFMKQMEMAKQQAKKMFGNNIKF